MRTSFQVVVAIGTALAFSQPMLADTPTLLPEGAYRNLRAVGISPDFNAMGFTVTVDDGYSHFAQATVKRDRAGDQKPAWCDIGYGYRFRTRTDRVDSSQWITYPDGDGSPGYGVKAKTYRSFELSPASASPTSETPTEIFIAVNDEAAPDCSTFDPPPPPPPPRLSVSPLVLDLDDSGIKVSAATQWVKFDLDSNQERERLSWPTGTNAAFLVLDRNQNGSIDDGNELFGNVTLDSLNQYQDNGFLVLKSWDSNRDGVIDSYDGVFPYLRFWTDANRDAQSDPSELKSLDEMSVELIDLNYDTMHERDQHGNEWIAKSKVIFRDARELTVYDINFVRFH